MILLLIGCSLIGAVLLIGICSPLSFVTVPSLLQQEDQPSIVTKEPFQEDWQFHSGPSDSGKEEPIKDDLRLWIASNSVSVLRSRGMTNEEIKVELMKDFSLTEEQVDELLAEH